MSKSANTSASASNKEKYPHAVSASSVSERFYDAVRGAARKHGLTLQTYARWCVEQALGRNTPRPAPELAGTFSLGTNLDSATNNALTAALKGKGEDGADYPKAQWLRETLAKAAGYTMTEEDKRSDPGKAAKERAERNRSRDEVLIAMFAENPDTVRKIVRGLGKTLADVGIYDEQEEEEAASEREPEAVPA